MKELFLSLGQHPRVLGEGDAFFIFNMEDLEALQILVRSNYLARTWSAGGVLFSPFGYKMDQFRALDKRSEFLPRIVMAASQPSNKWSLPMGSIDPVRLKELLKLIILSARGDQGAPSSSSSSSPSPFQLGCSIIKETASHEFHMSTGVTNVSFRDSDFLFTQIHFTRLPSSNPGGPLNIDDIQDFSVVHVFIQSLTNKDVLLNCLKSPPSHHAASSRVSIPLLWLPDEKDGLLYYLTGETGDGFFDTSKNFLAARTVLFLMSLFKLGSPESLSEIVAAIQKKAPKLCFPSSVEWFVRLNSLRLPQEKSVEEIVFQIFSGNLEGQPSSPIFAWE